MARAPRRASVAMDGATASSTVAPSTTRLLEAFPTGGRSGEGRRETVHPMNAVPTISALGTILGVWAHPDDEAYLTAGLMALARRQGNDVVVATATLGEHGTDDPAAWPPARLADRRR